MRATLLLLLCGACITDRTISRQWLPDDRLAFDAAKYPGARAVVLYRGDFVLMQFVNKQVPRTQVGRHEAVALLSEGAFGLAEVKVPFGADDRLIELQARIRDPDGRTEEVDARSILSDTSGEGERDVNAKFLRIPNVRVGSIIEYLFIVDRAGFLWAGSQTTMGDNPVRQYEFELRYPRELIIDSKEYNS